MHRIEIKGRKTKWHIIFFIYLGMLQDLSSPTKERSVPLWQTNHRTTREFPEVAYFKWTISYNVFLGTKWSQRSHPHQLLCDTLFRLSHVFSFPGWHLCGEPKHSITFTLTYWTATGLWPLEPEQWRSGDETGDNDDPDKGLLVPASQHNVGTASTTELCKTPTQVGGEETGLGSHQYLLLETQNVFPWPISLIGGTSLSLRSGRSPGEGNGYPLQYSYQENPMDRGAWQATVHRVEKSQIGLSD